MPEDLYEDGPAQTPPPTGAGSDAHASMPPESGEPSALIPKALLAGKKFNVGDEVVLKITAMHGDSVQVEYAPEKGKEGEEEEYEGDKEAEAPPEEQQQPPPDQGGAGNVGGPSMAGMMY